MTDTIEATTRMEPAPGKALASKIATEELAGELLARADAEGVSLVGDLTKRVLEAALDAHGRVASRCRGAHDHGSVHGINRQDA